MKVSWDDDIPKKWKIIHMFQTTNQFITIFGSDFTFQRFWGVAIGLPVLYTLIVFGMFTRG